MLAAVERAFLDASVAAGGGRPRRDPTSAAAGEALGEATCGGWRARRLRSPCSRSRPGTVAAVQAGEANEQAVDRGRASRRRARRRGARVRARPAAGGGGDPPLGRADDAPDPPRRHGPEPSDRERDAHRAGTSASSRCRSRPTASTAVVVDDALGARVIDLDRRAQIGEYGGESARSVRRSPSTGAGRPDRAQRAARTCTAGWLVRAVRGPRRWTSTTPGAWRDRPTTGFGRRSSTSSSHRTGRSSRRSHRSPASTNPGTSRSGEWMLPASRWCSTLPELGDRIPGAPNWANAFGRVRFSPDGSRLYASGFGPTAIFDTPTGALVGEIAGDGILAVSPDGGSVLVRDGRTAVRIVDLRRSGPSPTCSRCRRCVIDGAFSPDGTSRGDRPRATALALVGEGRGTSRSLCKGTSGRHSPSRSADRGTRDRGRGRRTDHLGDG